MKLHFLQLQERFLQIQLHHEIAFACIILLRGIVLWLRTMKQ